MKYEHSYGANDSVDLVRRSCRLSDEAHPNGYCTTSTGATTYSAPESNAIMDTTFPHTYECERLSEIPSGLNVPHYYFPGASTEGGKDGILVRVRCSDGRSWIGTFATDGFAPHDATGIFTTPDPERFCVASGGSGYVVHAGMPTIWNGLTITGITESAVSSEFMDISTDTIVRFVIDPRTGEDQGGVDDCRSAPID